MGGAVGGGLGGAALGTLIAPGIGTAIGGTLGGLAGSGIQNLVGGGGASTQPAAQPVSTAQGLFQSYTPQAQQQQDYQYQGLQNQLGNLAWSGLNALPGGVSPYTQLYPQIQQVEQTLAGVNPDIPGYEGQTYAFGPYGNVALQGALGANVGYQNLLGGQQNLISYGQQAGNAGLQALPQVQQAAFNPQIGQAVQNVIGNPYNQQALTGALTGANIGGGAAGLTPLQTSLMNQLGLTLPGLGQQAAATTGAQIPLLQQLAGQSALQGQGLAGQAQGLLPGMQQIGATGGTLTGAAHGFAQGALGTSAGLPAAQQQILQTGMDPQNALFNQLTAQTRDQANAMNAMSGLAGTPYAAGLTNQAMQNFDIGWQNQQLQRQAAADQAAAGLANQQLAGVTGAGNLLGSLTTAGGNLGLNALQQQLAGLTGAGNLFNQGAQGASGLAGQAGTLAGQGLQQQLNAAQGAGNLFAGGQQLGAGGAQLAATAAGLPAGAYNQQQQAALNALGAQNQLAGAGVTNLANLTNLLGGAGQQAITGLQQQAAMAGLPYNAAQTQAMNAANALNNQATFGGQQLTLPQQVIENTLAYLNRGTQAANLAGQLGQQAFNQNQAQLGNLGGLLSGGSNLLFGNQGLSGALGLGSGGLLGSALSGLGGSSVLTPAAAGSAFLTPGTDALLTTDTAGVGGGGGLLAALGLA